MKTNRIFTALIALTVLVLFQFTLVRVAEYQKQSAVAAREQRAAQTAERALGIHPGKFTLPGGMTL